MTATQLDKHQVCERVGATRSWLVDLTLLALVAGGFAFLGLGEPALRPWDEGLTAVRSASMQADPSWIAKQPDGSPVLHKPPLMYWLGGLSIETLGPTRTAVRLPGALFGWLAPLLVYVLARRLRGMRGRAAGWIGAGLLISSPYWWNESRNGRLDSALGVSILLGIGGLCLAARSAQRGDAAVASRRALWAGAALSLGAWIKNPIGAFVLLAGPGKRTRRWPLAAITFVVVGSIWYLVAWRLLGDAFVARFFDREALQRLTTTLDGHDHDLGTYHRAFAKRSYLLYFAAWTALIAGLLVRARFRMDRAIWLTVLGWLVILHTARTRLDWYLIPILPTLALTTGLRLVDVWPRVERSLRRIVATRSRPKPLPWIATRSRALVLLIACCVGLYGLFLDRRGLGHGLPPDTALESLAQSTRDEARAADRVWTLGPAAQVASFWTGVPIRWSKDTTRLRRAWNERPAQPKTRWLVYADRRSSRRLESEIGSWSGSPSLRRLDHARADPEGAIDCLLLGQLPNFQSASK